jgi:hypothetical protein
MEADVIYLVCGAKASTSLKIHSLTHSKLHGDITSLPTLLSTEMVVCVNAS